MTTIKHTASPQSDGPVPVIAPADPAVRSRAALMGPPDAGIATALMGPADTGGAVPLMGPSDSGIATAPGTV